MKDEDTRTVPFRSEIENFVNTPTWKYMAEEITQLMLNASMDNEDLDPYKEPAAMVKNQRTIAMGKMILDMPAQMAEEADEQAAQRARQSEEEGT